MQENSKEIVTYCTESLYSFLRKFRSEYHTKIRLMAEIQIGRAQVSSEIMSFLFKHSDDNRCKVNKKEINFDHLKDIIKFDPNIVQIKSWELTDAIIKDEEDPDVIPVELIITIINPQSNLNNYRADSTKSNLNALFKL